jgi:hypothetical protein
MRPLAGVAIVAACLIVPPLWAADTAVIVDSGSTNTAGFRITVERSGQASYTAMPRRANLQTQGQATSKKRKLPKDLIRRFYSDLEAAKPLAELPGGGCMKSVSFGTILTVEMAGQRTPDLSCGDHDNARLKALIEDTHEIVKGFHSEN